MKPNQGRNQVVARNTHKRSDEELAVSGNRLVNNGVGESSDDTTSLQENLFESVGDNLETSLVQNDVLNQHRNPPIPYVQNQVHGEPISARPKVANVPGNGVSNFQKSGDSKSFREKLGKFIKPQVIGLKLSQFNLFGKNYKVNKGETSSNCRPQANHNVLVDETSPLNPPEENHSNLHRQTEVYLQNGQTHTRPTNLALQVMGNQCTTDHDNISPSYIENRLGFAEVGVAKLHQSNDPQSSVLRVKNGVQSKSTSDLSPAKKSKLQETVIGNSADGQSRRPTSLSLKDSSESPVNSDGDTIRRSAPNMVHKDHKNTNSSDKIKRRVKTPVLVNKSRFSLYDDRLMFQSDIVQNNSCVKQLPKTSTSFHQLKTFTSSDQKNTDNTNLVII
ncbi:hypothetical protein LOTGIDRAFT_172580 [Lottia gigantea]|uniref:Uncharacterized protein n=1 Tax=Lottia gigantea TaxID=225164 RepID=V4B6B4_LOTGI|nr:hypothetical protein LOTGIDRAFT_172580 [Lottia gigantea]ESP01632.1 hypothetical protein LOTGIDRAFT_172580 [Lottia gigantea]